MLKCEFRPARREGRSGPELLLEAQRELVAEELLGVAVETDHVLDREGDVRRRVDEVLHAALGAPHAVLIDVIAIGVADERADERLPLVHIEVVVNEARRAGGEGAATPVGVRERQRLADARLEVVVEQVAELDADRQRGVVEVVRAATATSDLDVPIALVELRLGGGRDKEHRKQRDQYQIPQHAYLLQWKSD